MRVAVAGPQRITTDPFTRLLGSGGWMSLRDVECWFGKGAPDRNHDGHPASWFRNASLMR